MPCALVIAVKRANPAESVRKSVGVAISHLVPYLSFPSVPSVPRPLRTRMPKASLAHGFTLSFFVAVQHKKGTPSKPKWRPTERAGLPDPALSTFAVALVAQPREWLPPKLPNPNACVQHARELFQLANVECQTRKTTNAALRAKSAKKKGRHPKTKMAPHRSVPDCPIRHYPPSP